MTLHAFHPSTIELSWCSLPLFDPAVFGSVCSLVFVSIHVRTPYQIFFFLLRSFSLSVCFKPPGLSSGDYFCLNFRLALFSPLFPESSSLSQFWGVLLLPFWGALATHGLVFATRNYGLFASDQSDYFQKDEIYVASIRLSLFVRRFRLDLWIPNPILTMKLTISLNARIGLLMTSAFTFCRTEFYNRRH